MTHKKILVISPHSDDELFGCGGLLLKLKQQENVSTKVVVMSCSSRFLRHLGRYVSESELWEEFVKSAKILTNQNPEKFETNNTRLETMPMFEIIAWLDNIIDKYQPDTIFIPEPSYHQEHKMTYDAAIAACRPTYGKSFIKNVYLYEIPTSTWSGANSIFKPNTYIDISEQIDKKVQTFKDVYKVQFTDEKRNMLSEQGIVSHASYRGVESGLKYAESFMLIKSVKESIIE
jgi:LmbE family N-acetylglucosaminyl deacetylase